MTRVLALATVLLFVAFLGCAAAPHPVLFDRYSESWVPGAKGLMPLDGGITLRARLGVAQMITPAVLAPEDASLSNVRLELCVPEGADVRPSPVWRHEDTLACQRYSTALGVINRGTWVNPSEALYVTPRQVGTMTITYSVASRELQLHQGAFTVRVTP